MRRSRWAAVVTAAVLAMSGPLAWAADHIDGPQASADPAADITDVFAWMTPDASKVILVMDLTRNADVGSRFSDSVQYVFHTTSSASYGAAKSDDVAVVCQFDPQQRVECWAGDEAYVTGDASSLSGITSSNGKLRVFTGLRNDPFFFNLAGFRETARIVTGAAGGLTFDAAGCPAVDSATSTALVTQLQSAPGGGPAPDSFADFNVIAIVVEVDKSILTKNGPILSVASATYQR
jgi:hypothetical protein